MALLNRAPESMVCPACGATGPLNFRLEERLSLKQPDPATPQLINVVDSKTVWACVKCAHVVQGG